MTRTPLVLGVDGGGTKSLGLIADLQGHVLARHEVGPSNPNVVGFEAAAENLATLVRTCCEEARCEPSELRAIVFGLAGAGREESKRRIRELVTELLPPVQDRGYPILVDTDARIALEGAFGGHGGVVAIAGTGSVVIGKTDRGEIMAVGGWGRVLGDEGSGYSIGREALMAVTLHIDGRGTSGALRDLLAERHGLRSREDIIDAVYQKKLELSTLAPLVLEAATGHDVVSQRLLDRAAGLLVEQIRAVVIRMGIRRKTGLVLLGGLLSHGSVYANVVHMKVLRVLPQVEIRPPERPAAEGAVLLALAQSLKR